MIVADFIVDPNHLKRVHVPCPVPIKFVDLTNVDFLGETGRRMALAGFRFFVSAPLARKLLSNGSAVRHPGDSLRK
jgi:hypothetical protein